MNAAHERECSWHEQAVGWALHALEPDEEMAVSLHLPQCASCRRMAQNTERVLAGLGASVEQVDPPASLRTYLLSLVTQAPQQLRILRPRTSPEALPTMPLEVPRRPALEAGDERVRGSRPRHRSWLSRRGRRLLAASLALVGVLTIGGLAARTAQLAAERDAEIVQAQALADIVTRLDEPGTTHAILAPPDGEALAAVLVHDGQRTLVTAGLAPNATERDIYVVWGTGNGDPRPLATFDVFGTDADVRHVGSASEADDFSGYAISLEPGRAAPASPSTVVASGQVES